MNRNLGSLESTEFDLVVVGGGIFGACAALDATQRGLKVALIERADFCTSASANSFKFIHGGMRYLQHADFYRVRQSSMARRAFLRVAPHLVQPLPILVPTYGMAMKSKWAMRMAMSVYDTVTFDRNRGVRDPESHIPGGYCLSREAVLARYPGLRSEGLTGAAIFCDGQMYNPPRLVLAFVRSAADGGAVVANYVEATRFTVKDNRVTGVEARDVLSGRELSIRARCVLNAAGPFAEGLLARGLGKPLTPPTAWSRDSFFVVARSLVTGREALALQSKTKDPDARLSRGGRHLFLIPWRNDYTLVGVWHKVFQGDPEQTPVFDEELRAFLAEVNENYAGLNLTEDDIAVWNAGLIPFGENDPNAKDLRFGHRSRLVDHAQERGLEGLLTLIGVRFTTGPGEAAGAVSLALRKLGKTVSPSQVEEVPVDGGDFESYEGLVEQLTAEAPMPISPRIARALAHNHGTTYKRVFDQVRRDPRLGNPVLKTHILQAEVVHSVRDEMAQSLSDVILRRTDLGTGEYPGGEVLRECAGLMARELGWNEEKIEREVRDAAGQYPDKIRRRHEGKAAKAVAQPAASR